MTKVVYAISVSLDGFVAGPGDGVGNALGRGGNALHSWASAPDDVDQRVLTEGFESLGAHIVGRRMFDVSEAWHGRPPGDLPCFVVTHHPVAEWTDEASPFTFVDGVERAIDAARAVAGDKDVAIGGGASIGRQALQLGLVDQINVQLMPVLLGGGVRYIDHLEEAVTLEQLSVEPSRNAVHLAYRVISRSRGRTAS